MRQLPWPLGSYDGRAHGVNDAGIAVGEVYDELGEYRAARWQADQLDLLEGGTGIAQAIGATGIVVGTIDHEDADGVWTRRAARWVEGRLEVLDTLGGKISGGHGVNAAGVAVGTSSTSKGRPHHLFGTEGDHHAALWRLDGTIVDLGTLGGAESIARAINDREQVVGVAEAADGTQRAVLWHDGSVTDLGTLGGTTSGALGLNRHGQVVGLASSAEGAFHLFLWQGGTMADLNQLVDDLPPGWRLGAAAPSTHWAYNEVVAINDRGQIAATALSAGGHERAVLLTPIDGRG